MAILDLPSFRGFVVFGSTQYLENQWTEFDQILYAHHSILTRSRLGLLCVIFYFLVHLSRRLIGELIGYSWSGVRQRPSLTITNIFSETAGPIKAKFYVEPPWVGGTIFCSRHLGHMTKMAATPIYVKTLQKSSSPEPAGRFSRNLVCSIGDSSPS